MSGRFRPCRRTFGPFFPLATGDLGVSQDINVLALVKGAERYIFLYDDSHRAEALRALGRFASNPELSFTWYDAAVLSQKVRQNSHAAETNTPRFQYPTVDNVDSGESL